MRAENTGQAGHVVRILVVDDDPLIRDVVALVLSQGGYESRNCADAAEALLALEEAQWSVVITDISMPGGDGRDMVREMRARGLTVPVLALTGTEIDDPWFFSTVLRKPITPRELLNCVVSLLANVPLPR
jgi:DNA-binding response OmpR family regulator